MNLNKLTPIRQKWRQKPPKQYLVTTLKFLLPSIATTVLWLELLNSVLSESSSGGESGGIELLSVVLFAGIICTVIPAAILHVHRPGEYINRAHWLGYKLILALTATVSVMVLVVSIWLLGAITQLAPVTPPVLSATVFFEVVAVASITLPAPYAAIALGSIWSSRS